MERYCIVCNVCPHIGYYVYVVDQKSKQVSLKFAIFFFFEEVHDMHLTYVMHKIITLRAVFCCTRIYHNLIM
jgi:hypothetical protein